MNTAMLMDFYEMTMANGYFMDENLDKESKVAFDVFYRRNPDKGGYAVFAGLEQIIQYILNLHFEEKALLYIARNFTNNVRELEGAFTRVCAYAEMSNQDLTLELAENV